MALGAVVLGLVAVAPGAAARGADVVTEAASGGDWYYEPMGVPAARQEGLTGKGVTIGVIDEQINPAVPTLDGADVIVHRPSFCTGSATTTDEQKGQHTTSLAAYVVGNGRGYDGRPGIRGVAPEATLRVYVTASGVEGGNLVCDPRGGRTSIPAAKALEQAVADGCDIVSISRDVNPENSFVEALVDAVQHGVIVIAAGTNDAQRADIGTFPAAYNGVLTVGAMDSNLQLAVDDGRTVINPYVDVVAPGVNVGAIGDDGDWSRSATVTGTSVAAPIVASVLALLKQKYPAATNSQLLQSLLRNTEADDHPFSSSPATGYGYGVVSLRHVLRVDPAQYPDANPLISDAASEVPSAATFARRSSAPASSPSSTPRSEAHDADPTAAAGLGVGLVVAIVIAVVLVALVVAFVLVVMRRRRIRP